MNFNELPDKPLIEILRCFSFKQLLEAKTVCKRWMSLIDSSEQLKGRIVFTFRDDDINYLNNSYYAMPRHRRDKPYKDLITIRDKNMVKGIQAKQAINLRLEVTEKSWSEKFFTFFRKFDIESLEVDLEHAESVTLRYPKFFRALLLSQPKLKHLKIYDSNDERYPELFELNIASGEGYFQLKTFELTQCKYDDDDSRLNPESVDKVCVNLPKFMKDHCLGVQKLTLIYPDLPLQVSKFVVSELKNLVELKLHAAAIPIKNEFYKSDMKAMTTVTKLSLTGESESSSMMQKFFAKFPNLELLDLGPGRYSDKALLAIAKSNPKLTTLKFTNNFDFALACAKTKMPMLKKVELLVMSEDDEDEDERVYFNISGFVGFMKNNPSIEHFKILFYHTPSFENDLGMLFGRMSMNKAQFKFDPTRELLRQLTWETNVRHISVHGMPVELDNFVYTLKLVGWKSLRSFDLNGDKYCLPEKIDWKNVNWNKMGLK